MKVWLSPGRFSCPGDLLYGGDDAVSIHLYIGGVEKAFSPNSLSIGDELNTRGRCSFSMWDGTGEYYPDVGAIVRVEEHYVVDDVEVIDEKFEGTLDEPEESIPEGVAAGHFLKCEAVSYDQLCDRYHVQAVYVNQTIKQIIADAFTNSNHCDIYLEGVEAATNVQDGPAPIEKLVANWITVTDLLSDLSKLTGYKWFIDSDKSLHFFERSTTPAPFGLTDTSLNYAKFKLKRTRQDYRNVQIVRGGTTTTDTQTEVFAGDGKRRTFTLKYPVNDMSSVRIKRSGGAWTDQIVAVQGTEGAEWTYLKGSANISQATSGTVLAGVDDVEVVYIGDFPIMYKAPRDDEIEARKAIEGGGGIYEHVEFDDSIEEDAAAARKANSLLDSYAKIPRAITFDTNTRGLKAGQAISIVLSRYKLDDVFLITRVDTKDLAGKHLVYTVRCVGSEYDSWVQYFRDAFKRPKRLVARENETLLLLRSLREKARATTTITVTPENRPYHVGEFAVVGFCEVNDLEDYYIGPGMIAVA